MIYIFVIELILLSITGVLQELCFPEKGSLIVSIFSITFLIFVILGKIIDAKRLSNRDL